MPDDFELPAFDDIGRQVHDAFFRAMFSGPARAEALICTHWPRQLRWMLKGEGPRPVDSGLVRGDLSQRRTDSLYLVGGQGQRPKAVFVPEHKFRVESRTPGQIAGYLRTLRQGLCFAESAWLVPIVFFTGEGQWTVPGAVDESFGCEREIYRQMQGDGWYFLRRTREIDYERLSCEPVSRAMLGMMGLAGRQPYPREELRRMWRDDAAGRVVGRTLRRQFLSFAIATSALSGEQVQELAVETGLLDREAKMNMIIQPLILNAFRKGLAKGHSEGLVEGHSEGLAKGMSDGLAKGMSDGLAKGMSDGLAKGMSEGQSEGMSKLLLCQVQERFGRVPEGIEEKVKSAVPSDLEAWARAFVHARSLEDVFENAAGDP